MPEGMNDQELAESFAEYFHQQILKIRDFLDILPYQPVENAIPKLSKFVPMMKTEVSAAMVMWMKSKLYKTGSHTYHHP